MPSVPDIKELFKNNFCLFIIWAYKLVRLKQSFSGVNYGKE